MMDGDALYPGGFHPVRNLRDRLGVKYIWPLARTEASVRYYFIDFGISTHFGESDEHLVLGIHCRDHSVPELSRTKKYDPFKVDIYVIGNLLRQHFHDVSDLLALAVDFLITQLISSSTDLSFYRNTVMLGSFGLSFGK